MSKNFSLSKAALLTVMLIPAQEAFAGKGSLHKKSKNNADTSNTSRPSSPENNNNNNGGNSNPLTVTPTGSGDNLAQQRSGNLTSPVNNLHSLVNQRDVEERQPQTSTSTTSASRNIFAAVVTGLTGSIFGRGNNNSATATSASRPITPITSLEKMTSEAANSKISSDRLTEALRLIEQNDNEKHEEFESKQNELAAKLKTIHEEQIELISEKTKREKRLLEARNKFIEAYKSKITDDSFAEAQKHTAVMGNRAREQRKKLEASRTSLTGNTEPEDLFADIQTEAVSKGKDIQRINNEKIALQSNAMAQLANEPTNVRFGRDS